MTSRQRFRKVSVVVAAGLLAGGLTTVVAAPAGAATAKTYKNCTELRKVYPHGVGKTGAKDKVTGSSKPVTNFKKSTALYNANKKSDRDKDGVACEKR